MFLDLRLCLGWTQESVLGLEPWNLWVFGGFSKSARGDIHRSPRRAVILASRVMSFITRHGEYLSPPRELLLAARLSELTYSPSELGLIARKLCSFWPLVDPWMPWEPVYDWCLLGLFVNKNWAQNNLVRSWSTRHSEQTYSPREHYQVGICES